MTGPRDPAAAGGDRLRAGHADRERVIEALKDAFVQGRLTRDELDMRVGRALAARSYADLAALITDISAEWAAAGPVRPPDPVRRWLLAKAAAGSGGCLVIAAAAVWGAGILDPGPPAPSPDHHWVPLLFLIALVAVLAALGILANGAVISFAQRRSRRQLPPRPGPGGHVLDGGTGRGPAPPGPRTGNTHAGLRTHQPRQHISLRAGPAPRGARPASGAV